MMKNFKISSYVIVQLSKVERLVLKYWLDQLLSKKNFNNNSFIDESKNRLNIKSITMMNCDKKSVICIDL